VFKTKKNPFDPKTSMMIALAAAIALGSEECILEQTRMLKKMGITKEELAYLVRIVKHSQSSIVMANAKTAFDVLEG